MLGSAACWVALPLYASFFNSPRAVTTRGESSEQTLCVIYQTNLPSTTSSIQSC
ncbi:hypothetical protein PF005_g32472 [Phytophthora fragariae]|uniref:Uncharacterized protein n=1 Tax=Phytophthora fragariae TaxID=53985 RepID=A0A6A3PKX9_9STRA|nr:hypothetical protein PF009_g30706 [Phytophthora fragariae]KAE8955235.1 hypothetical protein PF011_g31861 [Phytophthora fragariae]KAE9056409.1 hypothetical protein PF007_g32004 [Phytophthora fragariae]KAE9060802.1 hypothetical protein PF010_g30072 [Phytophthora fragariae]KAE9145069.1 hypothetical protein PF004_g33057 [Phytophthora fragariae]